MLYGGGGGWVLLWTVFVLSRTLYSAKWLIICFLSSPEKPITWRALSTLIKTNIFLLQYCMYLFMRICECRFLKCENNIFPSFCFVQSDGGTEWTNHTPPLSLTFLTVPVFSWREKQFNPLTISLCFTFPKFCVCLAEHWDDYSFLSPH